VAELGNDVVRRAGMTVADGPVPAVLEPEIAVDREAVLVAASGTNPHLHEIADRFADRGKGAFHLFRVVAQQFARRMGVRGVDENVRAGDVEFPFQNAAEPRQEFFAAVRQDVVADPATTDGRGVHGDDGDSGLAVVQNQDLGVEWVADDRALSFVREVCPGHAGTQGLAVNGLLQICRWFVAAWFFHG
jgi:hypothetical protein